MPCSKACAFESTYAYVGNNPAAYVDPTGMRRSGVERLGLNSVAEPKQESAPAWLLKKSRQIFSTFWSASYNAPTTGFCGQVNVEVIPAAEGALCLVDDGQRLGSLEWLAFGAGGISISLRRFLVFVVTLCVLVLPAAWLFRLERRFVGRRKSQLIR
jgi:hypothetical protein